MFQPNRALDACNYILLSCMLIGSPVSVNIFVHAMDALPQHGTLPSLGLALDVSKNLCHEDTY